MAAGQPPLYMNQLVASQKKTNNDYWNHYNETTEPLSDWYSEVSKGAMHVTGDVFHVILPLTAQQYVDTHTDPVVRLRQINEDIFNILIANYELYDWRKYDRWSGIQGNFTYSEDGDDLIDMIVKVHRTRSLNGIFPYDAPGFAQLGPDVYVPHFKTVDEYNNKIHDGYIYPVNNNILPGSGVSICGTVGGPASKQWVFDIARHEIGHYLFSSNHSSPGCGIMGGGDIFYSPWELIKLGYLSYTHVNFEDPNYDATHYLSDISSRTSDGEILLVPVRDLGNGPYEYFLVANRQKISHWDRAMLGDTTKGNPWRPLFNENYGKGIYIYHYMAQDWWFNNDNDMECADGLYNWEFKGTTTPDWSNSQLVNIYLRNSVPVEISNDDGHCDYFNKDGRSLGYYHYGINQYIQQAWFGNGKRHTCIDWNYSCSESTDRLYTNCNEFYTSRELQGDRFDAWNIGYNQLFSPYSNPNTKKYEFPTLHSNIFIYLESMNEQGTATLKIYRADETTPLEQILDLTPPSKPTGLYLTEYYPIDTPTICHPVLNWKKNGEPDMDILYYGNYKLKYKILRATKPDMSQVPGEGDYAEIGICYGDPNENYHQYIDYTINEYDCAELDYQPPYGIEFPVRYKIVAVDEDNNESLRSDFAATSGITPDGGVNDGDGFYNNFNQNIITNNKLFQNYPNPFNPVTNITYSIKENEHVNIGIFDITGKLVKELVDEYKNTGTYIVSFNGSDFASGIYFYRIRTNSFTEIKKMILIK